MKLEDKKLSELRTLQIQCEPYYIDPYKNNGEWIKKNEIQEWAKAKIEKFEKELKEFEKDVAEELKEYINSKSDFEKKEIKRLDKESGGRLIRNITETFAIKHDIEKIKIKAKIQFIREEILC